MSLVGGVSTGLLGTLELRVLSTSDRWELFFAGISEERELFACLEFMLVVLEDSAFFFSTLSCVLVVEVADAGVALLKNDIKLFCFILSPAEAFAGFEPPGAMSNPLRLDRWEES